MTKQFRIYQTIFYLLSPLILGGCKIDIVGLFPDPDPNPPSCMYASSTNVYCGGPFPTYYQSRDYSGKIEVISTSTLSLSSDETMVSSGQCKAPSVSITIAGNYPVQQKAFHRIELSFSSLPEPDREYNFPDFTSSNPLKLEILGSSLYLKKGVISFQEVPASLALGGKIKFTGHFVANDNNLLDIKFDGVIPVPETSYHYATKADPDKCEREFNANSKLQEVWKVASQCKQSSDCVSSYFILFDSCSGIAVNKNASNLDDLEIAVEDYNSAFETNNACSIYHSSALPTCELGLCRAADRTPYYW